MANPGGSVEEAPSDCFIAASFAFGPCPCGCGSFKLVGFDAQGVARALVAIQPGQLAQMAMLLCISALDAPLDEKGTRH